MQFPNAYKGIRRIFTAEILTMISGIILLLTLTAGSGMLDEFAAGDMTTVSGPALALASISGLASIFALVAFFMNISGISDASKDEESFKKALLWLVIGIGASLVGSLAVNMNDIIASFAGIISSLCEYMIYYNVVTGIIHLAERLEDERVNALGQQTIRLLTIVYAVVIIVQLVMLVMTAASGNAAQGTFAVAAVAVSVIAGIMSMAAYVIYLRVLAGAKKMLER
ncbi:MAG: hypothetical protein IJ239_07335 [Eubacterium sp.]|nr:hypothetical protein [Eubacterium sp.]